MRHDRALWPATALPVVVSAGRYPLHDRAHEVSYRHPTWALHLHEVSGVLRREGVDEAFAPGDLLLSVDGETTTYAQERSQRLWCIHFQPPEAGGRTVRLPWSIHLGPARAYVVDRMARIARLSAAAARDPLQAAQGSAVLLEVLMLMAQLEEAGQRVRTRHADDAVDAAAQRIDAEGGRPLDIPRLAVQVGLTQQYLARRFRQRFGRTMLRYHLGARIDRACQLLAHTDMPLEEVARQLGFSDAQHLSKRFSLVVGVPPGRYRAERNLAGLRRRS